MKQILIDLAKSNHVCGRNPATVTVTLTVPMTVTTPVTMTVTVTVTVPMTQLVRLIAGFITNALRRAFTTKILH